MDEQAKTEARRLGDLLGRLRVLQDFAWAHATLYPSAQRDYPITTVAEISSLYHASKLPALEGALRHIAERIGEIEAGATDPQHGAVEPSEETSEGSGAGQGAAGASTAEVEDRLHHLGDLWELAAHRAEDEESALDEAERDSEDAMRELEDYEASDKGTSWLGRLLGFTTIG